MNFESLGLSPKLLSAVSDAGYTEPTPIQAEAIPAVLGMKDITGIAQTGTGKTAAFVLPMIDRLASGRARARMPRSLILEPTRELAAQVAENFEKYGANHKLSMALLIGGVSFGDQDRLLTQGVDVLIATPGRLMDQFERGKLLLTGVDMFVIDEADRMLDMGFIPDIEKICKLLPPRRQTLLFSATMPPAISRLAETFQKDPKRIEVARPAQTATTITQHVVKISTDDAKCRRTALRRVIESRDVKNAIVFCNRKTEVDIVAKSLSKHGHDAAPIHGDLPQSVRTKTLEGFRNGELKLLVASDVAARGLDIPDVGQVFNYSPPPNSDDYVHRIGRTGRAGRKGESFTVVCPDDERLWADVIKRIEMDVEDYMPEGLADEIEEMAKNAPPSRGRGRGKRTSRDESRGRRSRSESSSSVEGPDKTESPEKSAASRKSESSAKSDGSSDKAKKPRRDDNRKSKEPPVEGFGDNVPAFMR